MTRTHIVTPLPRRLFAGLVRLVGTAVEAAAFWGAVASPLAYPLLFAAPAETHHLLFAGLLVTNLGCLVLGHGYATDGGPETLLPHRSPGGDRCRN